MTPALAAVPARAGGTRSTGGIHVAACGSLAKGTSTDVLPINPGQGLRGEMVGCSLEGGEDAERKQGGSLPSRGVGAVSLSSSAVAVGAHPGTVLSTGCFAQRGCHGIDA